MSLNGSLIVKKRTGVAVIALLSLVATSAMPKATTGPKVTLTQDQRDAIDLQFAEVATTEQAPIGLLSGVVTPALDGRQVAASPFAGFVQSVRVSEGEEVEKGEALAVLYSPDAVRAQGELRQAEAEYNVAAAASRRAQLLADEGIAPASRAEEAKARASALLAQVTMNRAILGGGGGAGAVTLRAPMKGRVSRIDLRAGEAVEPMSSGVVIDQGDADWIEIQASPDKAAQMQIGDQITLQESGETGRVMAIGSALDPRTRSVVVRAKLDQKPRLVSGALVSVVVFKKADRPVATLPRSAVVQKDGKAQVFVSKGGAYASQSVKVIGYAGDLVAVEGLTNGQRIVTSGASQLDVLAEG